MAMFMGTADQLPQYSVFKLTKWSVTLGAPGQPEKSLLQIEPPFEIIKKAGRLRIKISNFTFYGNSHRRLRIRSQV